MRKKSRMLAGLAALLVGAAFCPKVAAAAAGTQEAATELVAKKAFPSVVRVETRNGRSRVATGVVIDKGGYIVTTALISPRDEEIFVTASDGRRSKAEFLGWDSETRLALLQTQEKGLPPIALARSADLAAGAWVGVVSLSPENTPSMTQGIVNSAAPDRLRLNVWVTRGSSGSPVVNREGQMVALLRGIYTEDQPFVFEFREREVVGSGYVFDRAEAPSSGMALGIPVDIVKSVAGEIRETGKVSRPWLGVAIAENEKGQVTVGNVEPDSPAELAKLKEGDIILGIDGQPVPSASAFVSAIRSRKPGRDIDLKVERDGKTVSLKAKLGEYPEAEAKRELEARFPRLFPPAPDSPDLPREPGKTPKPGEEVWKYKVPMPEGRYAGPPAWGKRKYVGLYLEPLTKELLEFFGVKQDSGLLVNRLSKDGPAAKAGVKVGDVIVRAEGREVESVSDLSGLVQDKKQGDKIKLDLVRDKKPLTVEVEVGEEEAPGLSEFFKSGPSAEPWDRMGRELAREFERHSRDYEKLTVEQRDKMKKLADEMALQGKKYAELAKEYTVKGKAETDKVLKAIKAKNQILYRV